MSNCYLCPRMCGVDRSLGETGFCGMGEKMRISHYQLHFYEEPPISGQRGSGTIFFVGCSLRCAFCQNRDISRGEASGREVSVDELCKIMLSLEDCGAHNINLVTPTHFSDKIAEALSMVKRELHIPVVYNTSGYENVEVLKKLEGLVDIYMPDLKYFSSEISDKYSSAPDYYKVASEALAEMYRQVGEYEYGDGGMLKRGLLIRHLVLPSCRKDSEEVIRQLGELLPHDKILISLMRQYTPEFALDCPYNELKRRITTYEYEAVAGVVREHGFEGFFQSKESASSSFTPDFKQAQQARK